ncbi:MAG TPA: hemolysin III family protein [Pseudonocardiaceae bacterium]|jgi:hemolysin III
MDTGVLTRPAMRGRLHLWTFFVAIAAGAAMVTLAAFTVSARAAIGTSVYTVTVLGLFGVSALYHRRWWINARARALMKRLDHSMIFLFIAGTYTPFALLAMPGATGPAVLTVVWAGAAAGVALKLAWPYAPRWLSISIYIALGWVAIFVLPDLMANLSTVTLVLLLVGGVCYTVGAVCYAIRWPDPWPAVWGHHEFFHAATVVAAICHNIAIWLTLYS